MQCCWKSLLGVFGLTAQWIWVSTQPCICHQAIIFLLRIAFSNNYFYLLSNTRRVVIIEILADVYAAKVENTTSTLTLHFHIYLIRYIWCSAQIPVTQGIVFTA